MNSMKFCQFFIRVNLTFDFNLHVLYYNQLKLIVYYCLLYLNKNVPVVINIIFLIQLESIIIIIIRLQSLLNNTL